MVESSLVPRPRRGGEKALFFPSPSRPGYEARLSRLFCCCRVLRDIEAVRQEATLLKEQMQIVKEDIKRVDLCVNLPGNTFTIHGSL